MINNSEKTEVLMETIDLSKNFGGLKAVSGLSAQVNSGDVFGIIGPNGAGKTVFLNMCTGIYAPSGGKIMYDGMDVTGKRSEEAARIGIARTFQNIQMFKFMTVAQNVASGCHIATATNMIDAIFRTKRYKKDEAFVKEKSLEILKRLGLEKYADTMAGNLSYGIQRKVEIARALALEPKIILLDEPAAGMNPSETAELAEFITNLNRDGYTIVVIEHDMKFVMSVCTKIMAMSFGQKILQGTPEEVRNNKEVQEAYFGKGLLMKGAAL